MGRCCGRKNQTLPCPCLLPGGAQIRRGGQQEGQASHTCQHPQDARDLCAGQHPSKEKEEDGGVLGAQTLKNPLGGDAAQGQLGSGQAGSSKQRASTAATCLPNDLVPGGKLGAKVLCAAGGDRLCWETDME